MSAGPYLRVLRRLDDGRTLEEWWADGRLEVVAILDGDAAAAAWAALEVALEEE